MNQTQPGDDTRSNPGVLLSGTPPPWSPRAPREPAYGYTAPKTNREWVQCAHLT
jgi:hypothetical protein